MSRDEIVESLNQVFREVFEDPSIQVTHEMTASDVPGWDSLNHVTLIVAIEKKFKLRFLTKEVNSLKNVGELIQLIQRKLAAVPAD